MAWRAPVSPKARAAAVKWLRDRVAVTRTEFEELEADAQAQAFTIGGTTQLQVVQTVLDEVTRSVARGEDLAAFKKRTSERVKNNWADKNSARLETAYRTTTQTALNTGRWFEMETPAKLKSHPFRIYDVTLDAVTTPLCRSLAKRVYPAGHRFLASHWPPLHVRCRTNVLPITLARAQREGPQVKPRRVHKPDEGFGQAPPLRENWQPKRTRYDPAAFAEYERKQAALKRKKKPARAAPKPKRKKPNERKNPPTRA